LTIARAQRPAPLRILRYLTKQTAVDQDMPSAEVVIVFIIGVAHGFTAIPFCIYLVGPIVAAGPFPKTKFKALSIVLIFIVLVSTYFFFAGMFIAAVPETENYTRNHYYKIWFGSQFFGMLLWALLLGLEQNQRK
jgi:hypothetical protein